jgi:hypothetical protein
LWNFLYPTASTAISLWPGPELGNVP